MKLKAVWQPSTRLQLILVLVLLFLLDGLALWYVASVDRERTFERARITLQTTAVSLEERVKRTVNTTDLILQRALDMIYEEGLQETVRSRKSWERFRGYAKLLPDAGSLWLLDKNGILLLDSTESPSRPVDFSDRDYFIPHKDYGVQSYVGPIVKGAITKKYSFTISRRFESQDGTFMGIVLAAMETEDFTNFRRNIRIGESGAVSVFRNDGALVLRQPMDERFLGHKYQQAKFLSPPWSEEHSGVYIALSGVDEQIRLIAFQRVSDLPLVAVTSLPVEAIEREWLLRVRNYSVLAGFALIVLLGFSCLVYMGISREARVRRELMESEARHRSIFENSLDALMLVDPDTGHVLSANPAACRMLRGSEEELKRFGQADLLDLKSPASRAFLDERKFSGRATGELTYLRLDGTTFPVDAASAMFNLPDGPSRAVVIFRDATERKRIEEQLRDSMARLERSNRDLQDFATIASHDLKEPLRKVISFGGRIKTLCAGSLGEAEDFLDRIISAANRMHELLDALLAYSRLGTLAVSITDVDLNQTLAGVLSDIELQLKRTGGRVEVGTLPVIKADPIQMRQLFQNLVSNGLKYNGEEEPLVRVSAEIDEYSKTWRIHVQDNGIGLDPSFAEQIFAPFQRLHSRAEYEGTGMGLTICRRIVERHSGSITVASAPGAGSTFSVTIPMDLPDTVSPAAN